MKATLDEAIQLQIDEVMDTFNFNLCEKALKLVKNCWINSKENEYEDPGD